MTFRTLQLRRNTAAGAISSNPTLAAGEPGYETDTGLLKIGDGSTEWTSLRYYRPPPLDVVGIEWDKSSSSPTLTRIDEYGESVGNLTSAWFDAHPTWGNRWRCVRNRTTGVITYGSNARGDGLTLDGSAGDVIVREPAFYYRFDQSGNKYRWWISPTERPGFTVHPHFNQRGDSSNNTSDLMYCGAYEGSFRVKSDDNTLYLASATGRQPWTGGTGVSDGIFRLGFDAGDGAEPSIGDTVIGATSGQEGIIEGIYLASGAWGVDAAGILYLSRPGTLTTRTAVFTADEELQVGAARICDADTTTYNANYAVTMTNLESFGNNLSKGAGVGNPWSMPARQLLMYIEYGTFDLQNALGKGIVDKASGTGFAGELTGAGSADINIGTNGSGTGTGTNGTTSVVWRGIENPWGNVYEYLIGMLVTTDGAGTYRITKRDGSGSDADGKLTETPGAGTYESGTGLVQAAASGPVYPVSLVSDALGCLLFAPDNSDHSAGSTSGYICDGWYANTSANTNRILLAGGGWNYALSAGPGCRDAIGAVTYSSRFFGARLEFRPGVV